MIGSTTEFSSGENSANNIIQSSDQTIDQGLNSPQAEHENSSKPKGFSLITSIALAITLIFALIAIAIYITARAKQATLKKIDSQITEVNKQINQKPDLEKAITAIYGQVTNFDQVFAQRNFWSQFLKEISDKNTLKSQYLSISAENLNKIQITGKAQSFTSLAYLVKSFQNSKYFSKVIVTNTSKSGIADSAVNFTIEASMSQSLLAKQSSNTKATNTNSSSQQSETNSSNSGTSNTPASPTGE